MQLFLTFMQIDNYYRTISMILVNFTIASWLRNYCHFDYMSAFLVTTILMVIDEIDYSSNYGTIKKEEHVTWNLCDNLHHSSPPIHILKDSELFKICR